VERGRSKAERLREDHLGESGIVFDVRWPVTQRYLPAVTEEVTGAEVGQLREGLHFARSRLDRRRPVFVPLEEGTHDLVLTSSGWRKRRDSVEMRVHLDRGRPVIITCWPAKRRVFTASRDRTRWEVGP
jgi:hypothetical protein